MQHSGNRKSTGRDPLDYQIEDFLLDGQARGLSSGTLRFYSQKLALLGAFARGHGIDDAKDISAQGLRHLLTQLSKDHTAGGVHCVYRATKVFLRWFEREFEPAGWKNPIAKVRAPRVALALLESVPLGDIRSMMKTCRRGTFFGDRDRAILAALLDTGCRAQELLDIDSNDVDLAIGQILVRCGKGAKPRVVFLGAKSRRHLRAYLRHRQGTEEAAPLWVTSQGKRLSYTGLRDILRRRARRADVPAPTLHSFRRQFALSSLRSGIDVFSLQRLMGHADLTVLRRYLAQTTEDLRTAHRRSGPVDNVL